MSDQILYYEAGQTYHANESLTDQGDHKEYRHSAAYLFSKWNDGTTSYKVVIRPDGVVSGGTFAGVSTTNDAVNVTAATMSRSVSRL